MPEPIDSQFIALASQLADAAGDVLRKYFRTNMAVDYKADASPVTLADRECESAMRVLIEKKFPGHGIVGEELGNVRPDAQYQWVLDPIDGTRSFMAGYPIFVTLISLVKDGVPILGVIDQPILKERWVGVVGSATTFNGKKVALRACDSVKNAVIATTSTGYFTAEEAVAFIQLKRECGQAVLGGDGYSYAMLASGQLDIVIDAGLKTYDFCALRPVIEGAGGSITDWQGFPLTLSSTGRVLASSNKALQEQALKPLKVI